MTEIPKNTEGRILRVKEGYNPNSSSMGSMIFILPSSLLAITVSFGAISAVIMSSVLKKDEQHSEKTQEDTKQDTKQQ